MILFTNPSQIYFSNLIKWNCPPPLLPRLHWSVIAQSFPLCRMRLILTQDVLLLLMAHTSIRGPLQLHTFTKQSLSIKMVRPSLQPQLKPLLQLLPLLLWFPNLRSPSLLPKLLLLLRVLNKPLPPRLRLKQLWHLQKLLLANPLCLFPLLGQLPHLQQLPVQLEVSTDDLTDFSGPYEKFEDGTIPSANFHLVKVLSPSAG